MSDDSSCAGIHLDDDDYTTQCLCRCTSRNDMDGFGCRTDSCNNRASFTITKTTSRGRCRVSLKSPRLHGKARTRVSIKGNILPDLLLKMIMIACMLMMMSILSEKVHVVEAFTLSVMVDFKLHDSGFRYCCVEGLSSRMRRADVVTRHSQKARQRRTTMMILEMINMESNDSTPDNDDEDDDWNMMGDDVGGGVVLDDLMWRVEKLRLEEQNKQRFLKSGARFLPYEECRKWVQAWGKSYWQTREDWYTWIAMGEKRNAYIPSRPDEYYTKSGEWISWEHFLITPPETSSSSSTASCNTTGTESTSSDEEEIQRKKPK